MDFCVGVAVLCAQNDGPRRPGGHVQCRASKRRRLDSCVAGCDTYSVELVVSHRCEASWPCRISAGAVGADDRGAVGYVVREAVPDGEEFLTSARGRVRFRVARQGMPGGS